MNVILAGHLEQLVTELKVTNIGTFVRLCWFLKLWVHNCIILSKIGCKVHMMETVTPVGKTDKNCVLLMTFKIMFC
jgi:hypothetical protein